MLQLQEPAQVWKSVETLSLETGRWVKNNKFPERPISGWIEFSFSRDQFVLAQAIVSGSRLGPSVQDSVEFLVSREGELDAEAEGNEYGYGLGNSCSSGWVVFESEGEACLYMWYETTSGTVLSHCFDSSGKELFEILLPASREQGFHHKELCRVAAGMTESQYQRWYNSHCLPDKKEEYGESADFHNRHLVPLGWEPMLTGQQFEISNEIDNALSYVHGKWAIEYGIGATIQELVGRPGEMWGGNPARPAPVPKGDEKIARAEYVLKQLEEATQKWRSLVEKWKQEPQEPAASETIIAVDDDDLEDFQVADEEFDYSDNA